MPNPDCRNKAIIILETEALVPEIIRRRRDVRLGLNKDNKWLHLVRVSELLRLCGCGWLPMNGCNRACLARTPVHGMVCVQRLMRPSAEPSAEPSATLGF